MVKKQETSKSKKETKAPAKNNKAETPKPLFYEAPIPLDGKAHKDLGLKESFDLRFTKNVNAIPINMIG